MTFHNLPDDLFLSILSEWIELIDASSLDIALCHHQYRQNYLNVIRGRMVISSVDLTYLTGKFPALLE
jgi:hypothetical protein